jgi:hypothetical protein
MTVSDAGLQAGELSAVSEERRWQAGQFAVTHLSERMKTISDYAAAKARGKTTRVLQSLQGCEGGEGVGWQ